MQYRNFGNTGMKVSEVGFGAWAIGGGAMIGQTAIGWGEANDAESVGAIHAAVDAGINFFDTADIYGLGHSEELLGKTIGSNKEILIATKCGNVSRNEQFTTDYSKAYLLSACEASLKRLNRDVIDYYQLHSAKVKQLEDGECIEAMQLLQQQGKIRHWGLSLPTFDPEAEAGFLMKQELAEGFQLVLNILNQQSLPLVKEAGAKGYGIIARMPLQFGLLTGKFSTGATFAANDHRKKRLSEAVLEKSLEALQPVWKLCEVYNITKTQLALSYILSYKEVSVVIPGIRTAQQVSNNTSGIIKLKDADINMIEALGKNEFEEVMNVIRAQG